MVQPGKQPVEIPLVSSSDWQESNTVVLDVEGVLPLFLVYRGRGRCDLLSFTFESS